MKSLRQDRQDLIDALVAETELGGITAACWRRTNISPMR